MKGILPSSSASEQITRSGDPPQRLLLEKGTRIIVIGGYGYDSATSTALNVLRNAYVEMANNISYLVPNRFEDGYGLSPEVVDQAKARGAQLIVTVDNGISSHAGVAHAKTLGIR